MAKGPFVTYSVERLITQVYLENPDWRAKDIREEVNTRLRKNDPGIAPGWPSVSTIQKVLARIHNKKRELPPDPEDSPWSISDITQHPIPPEVLPAVLSEWADALVRGKPLTVREARWVACLYHVIKESGYRDAGLLAVMAGKYALLEKTTQFLTVKDKLPEKEQKMWLAAYDDSVLYYFMTKDDRPIRKVVTQVKRRMPNMFKDRDEEQRLGIEALVKKIESS